MLYRKMITDSQSIPNFIDLTNTGHCQALGGWSDIILTISNCVCKKVLTLNEIEALASDIFVILNRIYIMTGDRTYYKVWKLSQYKMEYYIDKAVEGEHYEIAQNIKNLKELLQETIKKS